jgi:hypothetical protein
MDKPLVTEAEILELATLHNVGDLFVDPYMKVDLLNFTKALVALCTENCKK